MVKLNRNAKGHHYKSVGFYINASGRRTQKKWWLGKDANKADVIAAHIQASWKKLKAGGETAWTEEAEEEIISLKNSLYESGGPPNTSARAGNSLPRAQAKQADSGRHHVLTLYQAIDHYCKEIIPNLNISDQWKQCLPYRIEAIRDALPDLPLVRIGLTELEQLVQYFVERPDNRNTGKPIAIETALNYISAAKRLFDYLDAHEIWIASRRFDKVFKVSKDDFKLTNREKLKASQGIENFTVPELAKLFKNVSHPQQKLWMLLSLNCGFTQTELDNLLVGECLLDIEEPRIEALRGKTRKVVGKWILWDETVERLKKQIVSEYPFEYKIVDGVVYYKQKKTGTWRKHVRSGEEFYAECLKDIDEFESKKLKDTDPVFGGLVYMSGNTRIDNVRSAWVRLIKKTEGVQNLSYKYLRKTGSDMIRKIAGLETSQCYLAHAGKTVAEKRYTNADYQKLFDALKILRIQLQPMFD